MSDVPIQGMDFKQLRNEVQLLRDELAITKRKYEDLLYNLDDDNMSVTLIKEKKNMKTQIKQTEDSVKIIAEDVSELDSKAAELEVTAKAIRTEVRRVYAIKEYKKSGGSAPDNDWSHEYIWKNNYDPNNPVYWVYSETLERWEETDSSELKTAFIQTADGFKFDGTVKIDGDLITTGTIDGELVSVGKKLSLEDSGGTERASIRIYEGTGPYLSIITTGNRPILIDSGGNVELDSGVDAIIRGDYVKLGSKSGGITHILANGAVIATQDYVDTAINTAMSQHISQYH